MKSVAIAVLLTLVALVSAFADEVVLKSGARVTGTVEVENETEVVVRTELGRMRFMREDVAEVRREGATGAEAAAPGGGKVEPGWKLAGLRADLAPAAAGARIAVALADGDVAAIDVGSGKQAWKAKIDESGVAGIAADPGAIYVAARSGLLVRLNMRDGARVWEQRTGITPLRGPLLHRRGVFLFATEGGLLGIEAGTGNIRGKLRLEAAPDTPLLSLGSRILLGDTEGRVFNIGDDGKKLPEILLAPAPWGGRRIAASLRSIAVGGGHELVVYDPERQKVLRRHSVPGLLTPPLVADPSRAYAEIEGAFAALELTTGRMAWRANGVSRPTHAVVAGNQILVTTAAGELYSLRRASGEVRWSAPLGSASKTGPVVLGDFAVVVNGEGVCRGFRLNAPETSTTRVEPRLSWGSSRTIHSPEGFRMPVPDGWALSEKGIRGPVLVALAPVDGSPRFILPGVTDASRKELTLTSRISVQLLAEDDPQTLAKRTVARELKAAKELGYDIGESAVDTVSLAGLEWTEIRLLRVLYSGGEPVRIAKRVLVAPFWGGRVAWLESRCSDLFQIPVDEDLDRLAAGFAAEDPKEFEPPAEVRIAEAVVAALGKGDLAAALALVPESLRKRVEANPPKLEGVRFALVGRGSTDAGGRREVRVRIDEGRNTRFGRLLLATEAEGFVVVDAKGLLE